MTTISLKLPDAMRREVERIAASRSVSRSVVIREGIQLILRKGRKSKNASCLDLVRDLVGTVAGPDDASTNRLYLEEATRVDHYGRGKGHR